ncbi:hypothetical protein K488DRAFT_49535 [Vararia minispora EC-137]|uniref:Uncharacterized protein n=1 Tax=Vararia minispora EC-137 TaxID=1314806 RepID=A0ACB8QLM6_9AGAM|nr:hypothetical protein K488DRAFT_49535 [Vararia minispora EC-137]
MKSHIFWIQPPVQESAAIPRRLQREDLTLPILDPIRATYGPGFTVKGIITHNDSRMITIEHVPRGISRESLSSMISPHGTVTEIRMPELKADDEYQFMRVTVVLGSHKEAVDVVQALDGASVFQTTLSFRFLLHAAAREHASGGDLRVSWTLPTIRGYCGYSSEKLANEVVEQWNGADYRGHWIKASRYQDTPCIGEFNVLLEGLPADMTPKHMKKFKAGAVMLDRAPPTLVEFGIPAVEKALRGIGRMIYFEPEPTPYKDGIVHAWCRFESADVAKLVCESLHGVAQRGLRDAPLEVKRVHSFRYHIKNDTWAFISDDVEELKVSVPERYDGASISTTERDAKDGGWSDSMTVKIIAETAKDLSSIKERLHDMVRGEIIMDGNRPLWDRFFGSDNGTSWVDTVRMANSSVLIVVDTTRCSIRVVGVPEKRAKAIAAIRDYYSVLRQRPVHTIPFVGGMIGLSVFGEVSRQGKHGLDTVWLDLPTRMLCVRADEAVYEEVQRLVHAATERYGAPHQPSVRDTCLVCLEPPTTPVTLPCGDKFCKGCFVRWLRSHAQSRQFPVECFGKGGKCKEPVPLSIARDTLPPADWLALLHAAFDTHVGARPDEFRFCPTPDCKQVYRPGPRGAVYSCPSCMIRICPACHIEYHEGVTCEDREFDPDGTFQGWVVGRDVKRCPRCRVHIEREEGCNHMECTKCGTHICWVCLKTFREGGEVYGHMRVAHGGSYTVR